MSVSNVNSVKTVDSRCFKLEELFKEKFTIDFYQREYVWEKKQLEDLINDLSNAFLKCYTHGDETKKVANYDPYFMGEIVVSSKSNGENAIIDGQQRLTTFTLLLIYILKTYENYLGQNLITTISNAIYSDCYGELKFNLDIDERYQCMSSLFHNGNYTYTQKDKLSIQRIVDRYNDISECWNDKIDENNISCFAYWLLGKVMFSKVSTNSDDFAYIIFETMNDRGLSLTNVEMLRSYLLANIIDESERDKSLKLFDTTINKLSLIKGPSKNKVELEFFKVFLRSHYADDLSQAKETSDFVMIGNAFHRWVRDKENLLNLKDSKDYSDFIEKIAYFATQYEKIINLINHRDAQKYFYLIVNSDYGFTLQSALILASIKYNDSDNVVEEKIQLIYKYLTKVLSWRVWNHWKISQSSLDSPIYELCKKIREKELKEIEEILDSNQNPINFPNLDNSPTLNRLNKRTLRVLISLITEIVARESGESDYMLNKNDIEIEHIWSNHYDQHTDEFSTKDDFDNYRNNIGDLLVLPKSFNASYSDSEYEKKVEQYFSQNILAQSLNEKKYTNNPGFKNFKDASKLDFKPYTEFKMQSIKERAELYKSILIWNWKK